jgi:hypothetical protein
LEGPAFTESGTTLPPSGLLSVPPSSDELPPLDPLLLEPPLPDPPLLEPPFIDTPPLDAPPLDVPPLLDPPGFEAPIGALLVPPQALASKSGSARIAEASWRRRLVHVVLMSRLSVLE